jgi:hypothetical protein
MVRHRSRKDITDAFFALDIRELSRRGCLRPGTWTLRWIRNGEPAGAIEGITTASSIVLSYRHRPNRSAEWQDKRFLVELVRTPCHYGGERTWFVCPARGCGRRVALLHGGPVFACRLCHQLVYESQREQPHHRALRKAQSIRMKLGGSPNMLDPFPDKPSEMHWSTYQRLRLEAEEAWGRSLPPWFWRPS